MKAEVTFFLNDIIASISEVRSAKRALHVEGAIHCFDSLYQGRCAFLPTMHSNTYACIHEMRMRWKMAAAFSPAPTKILE